jgi:hypothetical protein
MVNKHSWFLTINNPLDTELELCKAVVYNSLEHRTRVDLAGTHYGNIPKDEPYYKKNLPIKSVSYFGFAEEVGKHGTKHLHCIIVFSRSKSFNSVKKLFPRANIQAMRGTLEEACDYVRKDGRFKAAYFDKPGITQVYIDNDQRQTRLSADGDRSLQEYQNEVKELRQELKEFKEIMVKLLSEKKILNTL